MSYKTLSNSRGVRNAAKERQPRQSKPAAMVAPVRKVRKNYQSPLNIMRWEIVYECGHSEWITSKSRPTRTSGRCYRCPKVERGQDRTFVADKLQDGPDVA